ncbi:hypothetical protein OBK15_00160 [Empedobacter falsenii]
MKNKIIISIFFLISNFLHSQTFKVLQFGNENIYFGEQYEKNLNIKFLSKNTYKIENNLIASIDKDFFLVKKKNRKWFLKLEKNWCLFFDFKNPKSSHCKVNSKDVLDINYLNKIIIEDNIFYALSIKLKNTSSSENNIFFINETYGLAFIRLDSGLILYNQAIPINNLSIKEINIILNL